jgi:hypothetical protein
MATNNKKPAHSNIKATIWQNASENGPFFATTFTGPAAQGSVWRLAQRLLVRSE